MHIKLCPLTCPFDEKVYVLFPMYGNLGTLCISQNPEVLSKAKRPKIKQNKTVYTYDNDLLK